ncbi:MAG: hypothetical protein ACE15E_16655 [Acidobacteriota bacterium]
MKKITLLTALPLFVLLLLGFAPGGFAQDQQIPQQSESQQQMSQEQSISGQLKSVDTDAKKIVVTTSDGTDMEFAYNDQTRCTGAQDTIEGLSTSSGSPVTVYYREENQQKLATRIDVQKTGESQATPQQPDRDTPPPDTQRPYPPDQNRPQDNPEQNPSVPPQQQPPQR